MEQVKSKGHSVSDVVILIPILEIAERMNAVLRYSINTMRNIIEMQIHSIQ